MREMLRRIWLLVSTTVRTSPLRSLSSLLELTGKIIGHLGMVAVALLVNGAVDHDAGRVVLGAAAIAVSAPANLGLQLVGTTMRVALMEKIGFAFDRQIAEISAGIPSLEHHERSDYADQLQVLRQSRGVLGGALNTIINTLNTMGSTVVLLVVVGAVEPRILLLGLTAFPALIGARLRYRWNKAGEDASAQPGRLARHLSGIATDPQAGMELRVFGIRAELRSRLRAAYRRWRAPVVRAERKATWLTLAEDAFFALAVTAVLGWLLIDAVAGQVSAGVLVLAAYAATEIQQSVTGSIRIAGRAAEALRSAGRLLWLRDRAEEINRSYPGTRQPPASLRDGIELENLTFSYAGSDARALEDVSVRLPAGSVVALVGENGAGKTTLIKLLAGLHRPTAGRILVDGVDLTDLDIDAWREHLSAAFQDHANLELSAQHAVGVGDLPALDDGRAATAALSDASAEDVLGALPDGLSTQLGASWHGGVDLSGGQWQKVALARGLMRAAPMLLIFDEPTAALDAPTEHALFERYAAAARAATERNAVTILVTHRFSTVRAADLIVVLDNGRVVECGRHRDLLESGGVYADLYRLQAQGYR